MVKTTISLNDKFLVLILVVVCISNGYILPIKQETGNNCSNITIVTRAKWGARTPKNTVNLTVPVQEFYIHHTATSECFDIVSCSAAVRNIQDFHMDYRGWSDIGYNFLVGEDGYVYEGRGWDHIGAHTQGYNSKSLGTSVIGDYMKKLPNQKALNTLKSLIHCAEEKKMVQPNYRLYGHRDAGNTTCPGDELYKLIQTWPHYSQKPPVLLFKGFSASVAIKNL